MSITLRKIKDSINRYTTNLIFKSDKDTRLTQRPSFDIYYNQRPGIKHPDISPTLPLLKYVHDSSPPIKIATMRLRENIFRRGFIWENKFAAKCSNPMCRKEFDEKPDKCDVCSGTTFIEPNHAETLRAERFFERCNIYDDDLKGKRKLLHLLKQIEDDINIYDDAYIIGIKEHWQDSDGKVVRASLHEVLRGNPVTMRMVADEFGEPGGRWSTCCSDDTEVLTGEGWKLFKDVNYDDKIATLNKETDTLEYQNPTDIIVQQYSGDMVKIQNKKVDLLVTPDHRMYVKTKYGNFNFVLAKDLNNSIYYLKKDCKWIGTEQEYFILPSIDNPKNFKYENMKIPMDLWLEFLGYYLSEGSTSINKCNGGYSICIGQHKDVNPEKYEKIEKCLNRMPGTWTKYDNMFCQTNKQLGKYLEQFGVCQDRHIPRDIINNISTRQLKILFDALMLGDGSIINRGKYVNAMYCTSSLQLANDVQELVIKCGYVPKLSKIHIKEKNKIIRGRNVYFKDDMYRVYVGGYNKKRYMGEPQIVDKDVSEEAYNGNVYCVTVPNGIIMVRRNGIHTWIGNCLRHRDVIEDIVGKDDIGRCRICGRRMYEIHYVSVEGGGDSPTAYYIGDEIIHVSRYSPSALYGFSPIVTLWHYALTLTNMIEYVYRSYTEQHLPKGVLAMRTSNPDSAFEFWKDVDDKLQKNPHYIPKIFLEGDGQGTGSGMEFVKFMDTLEEMQYIPVRDEIRRTIASIYGVTSIFMGDSNGAGGLNNESQQLNITNMAAESALITYNDYVMPEILNWLNITDWKYTLQSPFEEDPQRKLNEDQTKVSIAQSMLNMGFSVELGEDEPLDFTYSGTANNQQNQNFGGSGFGDEQGMDGGTGESGEDAGNFVGEPGSGMKMYIKNPSMAPPGANVKRGPKGSYYYVHDMGKSIEKDETPSRIEILLDNATQHYKNLLTEYNNAKDLDPQHAISLKNDLEKTRQLINTLHDKYKDLFSEKPEMKSDLENININIIDDKIKKD